MLDQKAPTPLYIQLKQKIENEINAGHLKENQQLPSERELCEKYNVSRITVRQAVAEAEKEGLIYKVPGKGTFVKGRKIEQGLMKLTSFGKTLMNRGLEGSTRIISAKVVPVDLQVANVLNIDISEQVVNLNLLGLANNEPIVYYDSYFPYSIGLEMINKAEEYAQGGKAFSSYDLYSEINIALTNIAQTFEAINSNKFISKLMKIPEGTAMLKVTSIYSCDEGPVEFKVALYKADTYKFQITRSI